MKGLGHTALDLLWMVFLFVAILALIRYLGWLRW